VHADQSTNQSTYRVRGDASVVAAPDSRRQSAFLTYPRWFKGGSHLSPCKIAGPSAIKLITPITSAASRDITIRSASEHTCAAFTRTTSKGIHFAFVARASFFLYFSARRSRAGDGGGFIFRGIFILFFFFLFFFISSAPKDCADLIRQRHIHFPSVSGLAFAVSSPFFPSARGRFSDKRLNESDPRNKTRRRRAENGNSS